MMLIRNALVVTMDHARRVIKDGAVALDGNRIISVGKSRDLEKTYHMADVVDGHGKLVLPGFVNAHNHLYQSLMRGLSDDGEGRGRQGEYRWDIELLRNLDKQVCYAAGRLSILEMVKSGITTTQDSHYINFHQDSIDGVAQAAIGTGFRLVLGRGSWDLDGLAPDELTEDIPDALRESRSVAKRWHGANEGRLKVILEASLLSQVSDELIISTKQLAGELGLGWAIHLQQRLGTHPDDPRTNDPSIRRYGGRAVEYLDHLGVLDPQSLLVHSTFADNRDISILSKSGAAVAHCPCANAWAGRSIVTAVPRMLEQGVTVGLGTDGALTNNSLDMFHAMNFCALIHKVNHGNIRAITAEKVLELATIDSAKALRMEDEVGSIEAGKKADLVLVDLRYPGMTPALLVVKNLIYSATSSCVNTVIIDGEVVMKNRQVTAFDEKEVLREGEKAAFKLLEDSGHLKGDPDFLKRGTWTSQ